MIIQYASNRLLHLLVAEAARTGDGEKFTLQPVVRFRIVYHPQQLAEDPDAARAEFEANLQRAIENNKSEIQKPGGSDAHRTCDAQRTTSPLAAARPSLPEPIEPTPQQNSPQPPLPANGEVPAYYLRRPPEPWRPFVNENGIIAGPWGR